MTPQIKIRTGRIGLTDVFARMPFRFGVVTVEAAVSATLELDLEVDGTPVRGYAADFLAYKWFDKRPEKSAADNVNDLLSILEDALAFVPGLPAQDAFSLWRALDTEMRAQAPASGHNALMAGFGTSMIERAVLDGMGRALNLPFDTLIRGDATGFRPEALFPELSALTLAEALPPVSLKRVALRHTVGMVDPIDDDDLPRDQRRNDGLPETLEDYLRDDSIRYLKIKVAGEQAADLDRLRRIAGLLERLNLASEVRLTLDGNEQFTALADFAGFAEAMRADKTLDAFRQAILFVEQPLDRKVALAATLDDSALGAIGLPLLIDESDDRPEAFRDAISLGYRGVSHKNCKGIFRAYMNAMLARLHSGDRPGSYFQSAEDLSCLPVVSLNADLAVVASLGIGHVERNGHHYFDGLAHLPAPEIEAALRAHPDLYHRHPDAGARLSCETGVLEIGSLQRAGMGFEAPDLDQRVKPEDWSFDRLLAGPKAGEGC